MKLYAWQPRGCGEKSMFVIAESEDTAMEYVKVKIEELLEKRRDEGYYEPDGNYCEYDFTGFGTDYYKLTVAGQGEVILNHND